MNKRKFIQQERCPSDLLYLKDIVSFDDLSKNKRDSLFTL